MPVKFTCPHCGRQTEVADQYVGTSGPCAGCGNTITVPRPGAGMQSPGTYQVPPGKAAPGRAQGPTGQAPAPQRSGALVVVIVLLGMAVVGLPTMCILVALLLPAIQAGREAARLSACTNNLRQLSLAIQNYHDINGTLPPSYIPDANGRPMHSWRVLILPYLDDPEANSIYQQYDFSEPWDGPNNRRLADQMPQIFRCPSAPDAATQPFTSYMVVTGGKSAFQPAVLTGNQVVPGNPGTRQPVDGWQAQITLTGIGDGTSNTLGVVEVAGGHVNWMEPKDLDYQDAIGGVDEAQQGKGLSSWHPRLVNVALLNGEVKRLRKDVSPQMLEYLIDRSDGQPIDGGIFSR